MASRVAFRPGDADPSALGPGQQALVFREARRLDVVKGRAEVVEKGCGHWSILGLNLARMETKVHSAKLRCSACQTETRSLLHP